MPRYRFEWLVPGMLRDKCIALIRGLPKHLRKQLVPAPDVVDKVLGCLAPSDEPLFLALSREIKRQRGVQVSHSDWQQVAIEPFYLMNIPLVDDRGKRLAEGRDLAALIRNFTEVLGMMWSHQKYIGASQRHAEFWGATRAVAGQISRCHRGCYPALILSPRPVIDSLLDYPAEAARQHRLGTGIYQSDLKTTKYLKKQLFRDNASMLSFAGAQLIGIP